jgi:ParB/RepB/Spo0J family partition protein
VKVENILHGLIHPAKENPNEMSAGTYKALKREVERNGFVQPVLVRPHPEREGHYEVIDGEHRWRVLGELGVARVPCVVDGSADDLDAATRRITMNRLRGQFVPVRLAHLLADLSERLPEDELTARLDMDPKELRNYLALDGYIEEQEAGDGEAKPRDTGGDAEPDDREVIVFVCTAYEADRVELLIKALTDSDPEQRDTALARQARTYNKASG